MKNSEAMFILNAYRPNGGDAHDATFCAALDQTRIDPMLGHWFAAQQLFDRAMCAKLGELVPPAGLREAILAGGKISATQPGAHSWWRQPVWAALAASVAVIFTATVAFWPKTAAAEPTLTDFVINDAFHAERHGGRGEEAESLQAMLSQADRRLGAGMPIDFASLRRNGCRTISCEQCALLEICFKRDGKWFHYYVARRADFPSVSGQAAPVFTEKNGVSVALWTDAAHVYVLAGKAGREALQQLL